MNVEEVREYCLSLPGTWEGLPFGEDSLVFKVENKIFLILALDKNPLQFNVKCDPTLAIEMREAFSYVLPGYHMNKQHWNTILVYPYVPDSQLREWIKNSYDLIVQSLPKAVSAKLS